jgi:Zn-dependent protease with chaperone function
MTEPVIRAQLYDGKTSGARAVRLGIAWSDGTKYLAIRAGATDTIVPMAAVIVGDRVGDTHRLLQLTDGGSLEVLDNGAFDRALQDADSRTVAALIRRLESHWRYAALAVVVILLCTMGFLRYGAPALAGRALTFIPASVDTVIGVDGLRILDRSIFTPSKLTSARQAQLQGVFGEVTVGASPDSSRYRLELRGGGSIKANALALPSGIVVLTDELEHLAINDDELRGVLAHEVGHLVKRHAMRLLIQSSSSALLLAGIFGDVTGVSTLVTAVPTVLVNAAYSRDLEREADEFAFRWMSRHNVAPEQLGNLLARLVDAHGGEQIGYLASHPSLRERVQAFGARSAARQNRN